MEDQHLPLPPGEVDVIIMASNPPVCLQVTPYTDEQKTIVEQFLRAAGIINSGDSSSSVRIDEIVYGKQL